MAQQDIADAADCMLSVLDAPEHWTQGHYAVDDSGLPIGHDWRRDDAGAYAYCLFGAYERCLGQELNNRAAYLRPIIAFEVRDKWSAFKNRLTGELRNRRGSYDIIGFNDSNETTFEDVREVLEAVKQRALAE